MMLLELKTRSMTAEPFQGGLESVAKYDLNEIDDRNTANRNSQGKPGYFERHISIEVLGEASELRSRAVAGPKLMLRLDQAPPYLVILSAVSHSLDREGMRTLFHFVRVSQ